MTEPQREGKDFETMKQLLNYEQKFSRKLKLENDDLKALLKSALPMVKAYRSITRYGAREQIRWLASYGKIKAE